MQVVYDNHTAVSVTGTHEIVNSCMKLFLRKTIKIGLHIDTWYWSFYMYLPWSDVEFLG